MLVLSTSDTVAKTELKRVIFECKKLVVFVVWKGITKCSPVHLSQTCLTGSSG